MPIQLEDEGRQYKRLQHTTREQARIERAGYTTVLSSNVSAIAEYNGDLYIRFHGGSSYRYPDSGDLYDRMLSASSKGKFVWNNLIRPNRPYERIANVIIPRDVEDRDMMVPSRRAERREGLSREIIAALALTTLVSAEELQNQGIIATDVARFIEGNVRL